MPWPPEWKTTGATKSHKRHFYGTWHFMALYGTLWMSNLQTLQEGGRQLHTTSSHLGLRWQYVAMVERKGMSTIRGWSKNVENLYLLILMILYSLTPATGIYLPQTQSSPQVAKMVLFLGTSGSRHAERYQQGHRPRARGRSPRQAPAVLTVSGIILR